MLAPRQSLWQRAKARNVNFFTLYSGQFTFSSQLLTLNYLLYLMQEAWLSLYCQVLWDSIADGRRSIAGDPCIGILRGKLDESYFSESWKYTSIFRNNLRHEKCTVLGKGRSYCNRVHTQPGYCSSQLQARENLGVFQISLNLISTVASISVCSGGLVHH